MNDSDAVRTALREAADRRRSAASIRDEVARLVADKADREEMLRVREEMDHLMASPVD